MNTAKKRNEDSGVFRAGARRSGGAKPTRRRRTTKSVVEQVRTAMKPRNRLAAAMGFLLGGFVPLASFVLAHYEVDPGAAIWTQLPAALVLGGLTYSAKTVYDWGRLAFELPVKALGFVVLLEGVMVASSTPWLAFTALGYLIGINGVATGCTLAARRAS